MKRFLSICIVTAAAFLAANSAMAFDVVTAFNAKAPNTACPAAGSYDVGTYPNGLPTAKWCSNYLDNAVMECNAGCTVLPPPTCDRTKLGPLVKANVGLKDSLCLAECKDHYLPGSYDPSQCSASAAIVVSCEEEWQGYADHC